MKWESEKDIYKQIGRFCIEFEQFCRSMEVCVRNILTIQGLTNEAVQSILLAGSTAAPLRSLLQNLIGEVIGTEQNRSLLSKAFKKLQDITEERNDLIHSKWFVYGYIRENETDEFMADGEKLHANRDGNDVKKFKLKKEKLEALINRCREASIIASLLTRCVIRVREVDECFSIENRQLVVNYQALKPIELSIKGE